MLGQGMCRQSKCVLNCCAGLVENIVSACQMKISKNQHTCFVWKSSCFGTCTGKGTKGLLSDLEQCTLTNTEDDEVYSDYEISYADEAPEEKEEAAGAKTGQWEDASAEASDSDSDDEDDDGYCQMSPPSKCRSLIFHLLAVGQ